MPPKRRLPKTRTARPEAPADAWGAFFAWGCDYFGDLDAHGVDPDDLDAVEAAWAAYGPAYVDQWPQLRDLYMPGLPDALPWALTALGDPRDGARPRV